MAENQHVTLILVPDETSPVRRLQVPRKWLRAAPFVALGTVIVLALGVADWVRLRIDAVDVAGMRAQTASDAEVLLELGEDVGRLERELGRIGEFERKVRVIADLPEAMPVAEVPQAIAGTEPVLRTGGGSPAAQGPASDASPAGQSPVVDTPAPLAPTSALGLDDAAVGRIVQRAAALRERVAARQVSYQALVEELNGKSQQLASTPSIWPANGWVTSGYGNRVSPFTGQRQFHSGLDIAASFGTDILAPASGRVVFAGRKGPLGKTLVVDHGFGIRTTYGHAAELLAKRGDRVERGQRIATVGSSGRSTGPHLHYAVAHDGRSVDPANYILD